MNVLILQGGDSPEREVSLRSAANIAQAARAAGHNVDTYDTRQGLDGMLPLLSQIDVVFPVLHGVGGEDGSVQQFLEAQGARFVGSDAAASKRCFDKGAAKELLEASGLPTPGWREISRKQLPTATLAKHPYVLKPRFGGSSIDTFIVRDPARHKGADKAFHEHRLMLLEELVEGTELTVGILGDETLPVIEIIPPKGKEFDYENKYNGKTEELCPPRHVGQTLQEAAQDLAAEVHQALGARHFSRVDLMMTPNGAFSVLEINTIPGLTEQSLFPKAAKAAGLALPALVDRLLSLASRDE